MYPLSRHGRNATEQRQSLVAVRVRNAHCDSSGEWRDRVTAEVTFGRKSQPNFGWTDGLPHVAIL